MAQAPFAGSGVFHLPPGRDAGEARRVDVSACRSGASLLSELGRQLAFPVWYGSNFDALHDCLADPACLPAGTLLIAGLATLAAAAPEDFAILMEVLASTAEARQATGSPLLILVDTAAAGLPALPAE